MCKSWQCWLPTIFRLVMLLQISLVCRTLGSNQDQWCDRGNFVKPPCQQQKLQIWPEFLSKRYAQVIGMCVESTERLLEKYLLGDLLRHMIQFWNNIKKSLNEFALKVCKLLECVSSWPSFLRNTYLGTCLNMIQFWNNRYILKKLPLYYCLWMAGSSSKNGLWKVKKKLLSTYSFSSQSHLVQDDNNLLCCCCRESSWEKLFFAVITISNKTFSWTKLNGH